MSLPHFFLKDQVVPQGEAPEFELRMAPDDLKHAKVLRLAAGEHIAVVDAASDYFECEVTSFEAGVLCVRISQHLEAPRRPKVVLVQGLAKGDKMDTIVRHATEVGISGFVPLVCARSIVKLDAKKAKARKERWEAIAKSAAMQSGRTSVPEISSPMTVAKAAKAIAEATAVLVCWEEAPLGASFSNAINKALQKFGTSPEDACIAVVIGPEGGLESEEVDCLMAACENAYAVSLGPSILRTETAGIVAPALALYELEAR